jgi:capsid portal protein
MNLTHINLTNNNINLEFPIVRKASKGWMSWGNDNLFPKKLLDFSDASPLNSSIISNKINYIIGDGIDTEKGYYGLPNLSDTWDNFLEKITRDYVTFGSFAMQIITNLDGTNVSMYHQDVSKVRIGKYDKYNRIESYYISNDWSQTFGRLQPVELKSWGTETPQQGVPYLLYYKDYHPSVDYYSVPSWFSAINYVIADGLLSTFYKQSINQNFSAGAIISMPNNPSLEDRTIFQEELEKNFAGVDNANSILVLWNESGDLPPKITPFNSSTNSDLYNSVADICQQKIINSHQVSSGSLSGIPPRTGGNSFNSQEIITSYIVYDQSVIKPLRNKILSAVNTFVVQNGYNKLVIKELPILEQVEKAASFTQSISIDKNKQETKEK